MRVWSVSCLCAVLTASPQPVAAAEPSLLRLGIESARSGDLEAAESHLRRALAEQPDDGAETTARRRERLSTLHVLGAVVQNRGRYDEAEELYRRAVQLAEPHAREEGWDLAYSLGLLSQVVLDRGQTDDAGALAERALAVGEKAIGPHRPDLAMILNTLAEVKIVEQRLTDAEELLRRADRLLALHDGSTALRASVAARRGWLELARGHYGEAEPVLEKALALTEEAFGVDTPHSSRLLQALADCYRLRNRPRDAQALYVRAVALINKIHGPAHPQLVPSLTGLAQVAERLEDWPEATKLHERIRSIRAAETPTPTVARK